MNMCEKSDEILKKVFSTRTFYGKIKAVEFGLRERGPIVAWRNRL